MQKIVNKKSQMGDGKEPVFFGAAQEILSSFSERAQEIIKKRFGLASEKPETLEKIGRDYKITRERVRQIIADVAKKISQKMNSQVFKKAESQIIFTIEKNFGIIKADKLLQKLAGKDIKESNAIVFLCICSDKISKIETKGVVEAAWITKKEVLDRVKKVGEAAETILKKENRLMRNDEISTLLFQMLGKSFSQEEILSHLDVLSAVKKNNFGRWGMANWAEISPKGTKEKIYVILKEKKRPLHFMEIAQIMDEYGLSKKKAHPQTIHNELIKNEKFVLIGRGIYALREWGYREGTVLDVLKEIFTKSKRPMTKDEILTEILKIRKVKKATILINLGNRNFFSKEKNQYFLKKQK